jgi:hypothetical protein
VQSAVTDRNVPGPLSAPQPPRKRKQFFFEKKNQKTFAIYKRPPNRRHREAPLRRGDPGSRHGCRGPGAPRFNRPSTHRLARSPSNAELLPFITPSQSPSSRGALAPWRSRVAPRTPELRCPPIHPATNASPCQITIQCSAFAITPSQSSSSRGALAPWRSRVAPPMPGLRRTPIQPAIDASPCQITIQCRAKHNPRPGQAFATQQRPRGWSEAYPTAAAYA